MSLIMIIYHYYLIIIFANFVSSNFPKNLNLGVIGPKFSVDLTINVPGTHAIAGFLMAIHEINNKTDQVPDNLLPSTYLSIAFRSPQQSFLQAISSALQLSETAFNNTGILGLIGTSATASTKATAKVFANLNYKIPQISYGAQSSELGHKDIYPYHLRICPSDAFEGQVLANFLYHYFGWTAVTVFYSGDVFGNDAMLEFHERADVLGITVESKFTFWSGIKDFSSVINSAIATGGVLKIFVLLMKSADAGLLLEQGYNLGLFTTGTQILGTEYIISSNTWTAMSSTAPVAKIMKGVIGVSPTITTARTAPAFQQFIKRWKNQKSTQWTNSDGSIGCSYKLDDDGNTYLYRGSPDGPGGVLPKKCSGVDFSTFSSDGSDIDDLAIYAYDAAYALAKGLHVHYYINGHHNITGDDLKEVIIQNVSFTGISGNISFNQGGIGVEAYGQGDRAGGLEYTVYNFDPTNYHAKVNKGIAAIRKIGMWGADNVFRTCAFPTDEMCSLWTFNTIDNSIPKDMAPIHEVQMPATIRIGLRTGVSIALTLTIFFTLVVIFCGETRIIKAAQPGMLLIVLLGATLACIRVILATYDITEVSCVVGKWLGHLSFGLVFGAMILKTWRVNMVVNSGMKKVKITMTHLQRMLAVGIFLLCVYLAIDKVVGKPHRDYEQYFDGHTTMRLIKCSNDRPIITTVLFAIEGLVLFVGARLCWSTKDVPDAVNDSKYIAMALYLIVFVCAVTFPIVFLSITPTPSTMLMIMAIGFIIATTSCLLILFGPKAVLLWEGADVDENFAIVKSSDPNGGTSNAPSNNALLALRQKIKKSSGASSNPSNSIIPSRFRPPSSYRGVNTNMPHSTVVEYPDQQEEKSAPIRKGNNNNNNIIPHRKATPTPTPTPTPTGSIIEVNWAAGKGGGGMTVSTFGMNESVTAAVVAAVLEGDENENDNHSFRASTIDHISSLKALPSPASSSRHMNKSSHDVEELQVRPSGHNYNMMKAFRPLQDSSDIESEGG